MKRFLTIFCAIAFSGAALSAQNNADTIRVNRNNSDTLVIIVKEKQSIDRQAKKEQRLAEKAQKPAYMVNVGYDKGYRADIELSWADKSEFFILRSSICRYQVFILEDTCYPFCQSEGGSRSGYHK